MAKKRTTLIKANKTAGTKDNLLRAKQLSRKAKRKLYKLRPIAIYPSAISIINKKLQNDC